MVGCRAVSAGVDTITLLPVFRPPARANTSTTAEKSRWPSRWPTTRTTAQQVYERRQDLTLLAGAAANGALGRDESPPFLARSATRRTALAYGASDDLIVRNMEGRAMVRSHLDIEKELSARGVDVPKYPPVPTFFEAMANATAESDFLAACERWEADIRRLFGQLLLDRHRETHDRRSSPDRGAA